MVLWSIRLCGDPWPRQRALAPIPPAAAGLASWSGNCAGRAAAAGRWLAPGGVSCFTFISLHFTSACAPSRLSCVVCVCEPSIAACPEVLVKLRRLRYCIPTASSSLAPGPHPSRPSLCPPRTVITAMSQSHAPERPRKYKEEPAPGAAQKLVSPRPCCLAPSRTAPSCASHRISHA